MAVVPMAMMHWAGCQKSKRKGRCRPDMDMIPWKPDMEKTVCLWCEQPSGRSSGCGRKTRRCPSKREAGETEPTKQDWHGNRKQLTNCLYPVPDQTVLQP